jgi:hypothetical protein
VGLEMLLMVEAFIAVGNIALVTFPWFQSNFDLFLRYSKYLGV